MRWSSSRPSRADTHQRSAHRPRGRRDEHRAQSTTGAGTAQLAAGWFALRPPPRQGPRPRPRRCANIVHRWRRRHRQPLWLDVEHQSRAARPTGAAQIAIAASVHRPPAACPAVSSLGACPTPALRAVPCALLWRATGRYRTTLNMSRRWRRAAFRPSRAQNTEAMVLLVAKRSATAQRRSDSSNNWAINRGLL